MGYQQLTMYDCLTDQPEVWECMKTCRRFGEKVDKFPGTGEPRCALWRDEDWKQFVFDNTAHFICKLYEERTDE